MKLPIPAAPASVTRLPNLWSAMPSLRWSAFLAASVLAGLLASANIARADLLVLQPGGGGRGPGSVFRFDENQGGVLGRVGEPNEGMRALCAGAASGDAVLVSAQVLGDSDVLGFDAKGRSLGPVTSARAAQIVAMRIAADGTFYGIVEEYPDGVPVRSIVRKRATDAYSPTPLIPATGSQLVSPEDLLLADDDTLLVADAERGVLRFDAKSGAFLNVLIASAPESGLNRAMRLARDAQDRLLVACDDATVRRYNATSGAFLDVFVAAGSGGLASPRGLAFAANGDLYVTSNATHQVLRFDGATGAFLGVAASDSALRDPRWLVVLPTPAEESARHAQ